MGKWEQVRGLEKVRDVIGDLGRMKPSGTSNDRTLELISKALLAAARSHKCELNTCQEQD